MDIIESIETRRSVRTYKDERIPMDTIRRLLELGTKAPTGSAMEPWGFVVIQGKEEIDGWSEQIKAHLLAHLDQFPYLQQYEKGLRNPGFSVFNHADTLLVIYGDTASHWYRYDCALAAENITLAAHSMGIGTCWIGFAEHMLNTPAFKERYGVPQAYELVCPMTLGWQDKPLPPCRRRPPVIFNQK